MKELRKDLRFYIKVLESSLRDHKTLDMKTIAFTIGCVLFCILVDMIATFFLGFNYINDIALVVGTLIYIKFYLRPQRKEFENLLELHTKEKDLEELKENVAKLEARRNKLIEKTERKNK